MTSPTLREALEACPFCGEQPYSHPQNDDNMPVRRFYIWCHECQAAGPVKVDPESAIKAWNAATPSHEAGRRAWLEEAAVLAETRHEQWRMPHPDDAEAGEVCCDVSACRDIATAIRNLAGDEGIGT